MSSNLFEDSSLKVKEFSNLWLCHQPTQTLQLLYVLPTFHCCISKAFNTSTSIVFVYLKKNKEKFSFLANSYFEHDK